MYFTTIRVFLTLIFLGGVLYTFSYGGEEYIGGICEERDGKWVATEGGDGRLTSMKNLLAGRYYKLDYREGLLCAKPEGKQSKWGYINERGYFVITPQFDWAEGFKNGVAKVKKDGTWGTVDKNGKYKENKKTAKTSKNNISQEASDLMMSKHMLATKIKVVGKKLRVLVNFQHDRAVRVIHDPDLVSLAKRAGLNRIEFHDWSGFSKDMISTEVK